MLACFPRFWNKTWHLSYGIIWMNEWLGKWNKGPFMQVFFSWLDEVLTTFEGLRLLQPSVFQSRGCLKPKKARFPLTDLVATDKKCPSFFVFQKLQMCLWGNWTLVWSFSYNIKCLFVCVWLSWTLIQIPLDVSVKPNLCLSQNCSS